MLQALKRAPTPCRGAGSAAKGKRAGKNAHNGEAETDMTRSGRAFRQAVALCLALAGSCCSQPVAESAQAGEAAACEREMARASAAYDIPLGVLYAVGLTETGRRGSLAPFALNIDGAPFFPPSLEAALRVFSEAKRNGARLIDIGCMQINHTFHGARFRSLIEMFEPRRNVDYAARFLRELRRHEPNWTLTVARYHAGPHNDPAQRRYVCAVVTNMVAAGFGSWTPGARAFCEGAGKNSPIR